MNDFFKKVIAQITALWGKWSLVQRAILIGIVVVAVGGLIALVSVSSAPTMVPVIDTPITDEAVRDRIITRINEEGVRTAVNAAGIIQVPDEKTARKMKAILFREDLIPSNIDPWAIFDQERWSITDFEREVNLRRAITRDITNLVKAYDEVDNAVVNIVMPERALFQADQNPVTASVIITPKPGSDITENRKKIEGIQKILRFAVEGLKDENIVITDQNGLVLNDFENMKDFDRIALVEKEAKHIRTEEDALRKKVLQALQQTFSADRVRDLNIKIEKDMSQKTSSTTEVTPIILKERTPGLAYDDSERVTSVTVSESVSETEWEGTGFNPEGPPGAEGQTAPAFRDMSNVDAKVRQTTRTHNEELNKRVSQIEQSPTINRITVSVNIDGTWKLKYDEKGNPVINPDGSREREYTALPPEERSEAENLIKGAIGFDAAKGYLVNVQNIRFDRTREFAAEDEAFARSRNMKMTLLIFMAGLIILLVAAVVIRFASREVEKRKRQKEEEISRQQEAMRISAMQDMDNEGVEVSMSVEEKRRMELQENAINMAKEHPGDVAQLIRTWLMEE